MNKENHKNILFCSAMLLFAIISFFRYFKHMLFFHSAPMGWMQNYHNVMMITAIGMLVIIAFVGYVLAKVDEKEKNNIFYLSTILGSVMYAFFWTDSYFGTMDLYAWIGLLIIVVLMSLEKMTWLVIIGTFIMGLLCPMSFITVGVMVWILLFERYITTSQKTNLVIATLSIITYAIGVIITKRLGYFTMDVQGRMTSKRAIILFALLIPYFIVVLKYILKLYKNSKDKKEKLLTTSFAVGVLPGVVIWSFCYDYVRAICYGISYYTIILMSFELVGNKLFCKSLEEEKSSVKKYVPISWIFVMYLMIFIAFWLLGEEPLGEEAILGN